jgi:hypothetical protein
MLTVLGPIWYLAILVLKRRDCERRITPSSLVREGVVQRQHRVLYGFYLN